MVCSTPSLLREGRRGVLGRQAAFFRRGSSNGGASRHLVAVVSDLILMVIVPRHHAGSFVWTLAINEIRFHGRAPGAVVGASLRPRDDLGQYLLARMSMRAHIAGRGGLPPCASPFSWGHHQAPCRMSRGAVGSGLSG